MPNKTLVLGATGLLGSHLLWELTREGPVVGAYRNEKRIEDVRKLFAYYGGSEGEHRFNLIEWKPIDVLDFFTLQQAIHEANYVYHAAALVSFHRIDFYRCIKQNREGTANVVNACLSNPGVRLCYVSSTAAVGKNQQGPINEGHLWKASDKNSGYSVSKFGAEKEVWRGMEEGLNAVIINPCTILGPGRWEEGSMEMFLVAQKGLRFYPSGANATVDARDVATSAVFLMKSNLQRQRFLCIGENRSFQSLFTEIALAMKKPAPSIRVSRRVALLTAYLMETIALLRSKRQGMTIEATRAAFNTHVYDDSKLKALENVQRYSLTETIENAISGRIRS
ncbi:MAG: NAD-dependent epimerase/dehydratase family protein [Flavobacteriales bacterium]